MSFPSLPTPIADSDPSYTCMERTSSPCGGELLYKDGKGQPYCVLHYPRADKRQAFEAEIKKKLESKDFNFERVWFPSGGWFRGLDIEGPANFRRAVFDGGGEFYKTLFRNTAIFEAATFSDRTSFEHAKFIGKVDFSEARFQKDANFRHAKFCEYSNFWRCTFGGSAEFDFSVFIQTASFWPAIFESTASFSKAKFTRGNFRASEFKAKAVFTWCVFDIAEFTDASFSQEADFFSARFMGEANFVSATFEALAQFKLSEFNGDTLFTSAAFNGKTDFRHCVFKDVVGFSAEYGRGGFGRYATCDFQHTRFESPKRVSFHSMKLRPHWFINTDPREFQFIDVRWLGNLRRQFIAVEIGELRNREEQEEKEATQWRAKYLKEMEEYGDQFTVERLKEEEEEVAKVSAENAGWRQIRPQRLLAITCRQLAGNAEENHRYEEASRFRYWAMDARRLEAWKGFAFWRLSWWYWLASGYGERTIRALLVFIAILLVFATLYRLPTPIRCASPEVADTRACIEWTTTADNKDFFNSFFNSAVYTIEAMTLQKPEPRPKSSAARLAVTLCTILGPLQGALLALAVRRKFMR
jgi:uncharacterized protein YjbI with pentapeptide repeats